MPKSTEKNILKENQKMNAFENDETLSGGMMDDFANAESGSPDLNDDVVDMSFDDVYDEIVHPTGTECKLRCVSADKGVDKNGATYWRLSYEDADDVHVKQIRVFIGFPKPDFHDARQVNNKKKAFMNWKLAHGLDLAQPVRLEDCVGLEAWAILRQTEDEQYGAQNDVKKWIIPGA